MQVADQATAIPQALLRYLGSRSLSVDLGQYVVALDQSVALFQEPLLILKEHLDDGYRDCDSNEGGHIKDLLKGMDSPCSL
ncbi:hypothetical protein [Piscirickettsia salmonis]|uniref:hypothetical protein n=1 Tax=Piscirickettsia salmonis TaxID=1238 RepID=UPI0007C96EC6|nr:hypothetical protein A0O36_02863 [Piscirickettsiaceae bacterium NZ-RLO1]